MTMATTTIQLMHVPGEELACQVTPRNSSPILLEQSSDYIDTLIIRFRADAVLNTLSKEGGGVFAQPWLTSSGLLSVSRESLASQVT